MNEARIELQSRMINEIYRRDSSKIIPLTWGDIFENTLILTSFFMVLTLVLAGWAMVISYSGLSTQYILRIGAVFSCVVSGYIYFIL